MVEDLAQQLEEIHLHLVEALVLQQFVQLRLPFLVVQGREEFPDQRRNLPAAAAAAAAAATTAAAPAGVELKVLERLKRRIL